MKSAKIAITSVAVICPHCDLDQPEPDHGSLRWEPHQLTQFAGTRQCIDCDKTFTLRARAHILRSLREFF